MNGILNHRDNESPTLYAIRLGEQYVSALPDQTKKEKGQFITPVEIARFMSGQVSLEKDSISILDPGCGTCVLSCALIERLTGQSDAVRHLRLVAYETDPEIIPLANRALAYLAERLMARGVTLEYVVHEADFILRNHRVLDAPPREAPDGMERFDVIISNPPYFKLPKSDRRVVSARRIVDGQPNIYSLFMAVSAGLLKSGGEMVFIVPRSFTSGRYFRLFRAYLLSRVELPFIHLFNTRRETFAKDKVLQETVIIKGIPRDEAARDRGICISYSEGLADLHAARRKVYPCSEIVDAASTDKILHLPVSTRDEAVIRLFRSWRGTLHQYDIEISTGPVVAFRMKDYLCGEAAAPAAAPLFWLHNVVKMLVCHPVMYKGKRQYIRIAEQTQRVLVPNRNYVFLRRFSTKDDKSRLVAAPYVCNVSNACCIGIENKLNYIYRPKGHLDRAEVIGLSALLDSDLFDAYFRTFNGNVNVSATELRNMPLPDLAIIKSIGEELILRNDFSMENVNEIVNKFFPIN